MQKNSIIPHLVSTSNGFYDFDITDNSNAKIYRATVDKDIKKGDMFNVFYGDGSKTGCKWVGDRGIDNYLIGDLEKSIKASKFYKEANQVSA
jgi:hypothetical protein